MKLDSTIEESPDNVHFPYNIVSEKCSQIFFQHIPTEEEVMERYSAIQKQFPRFPHSPENLYKHNKWHGYRVLFWIIEAPRRQRYQRWDQYYTAHYFHLWIQKHNITTYQWYLDERKKSNNPHLPYEPHIQYGGKNWTWTSILKKIVVVKYSWEEFKKIIQKLQITKKEIYQIHCKEDPRLPTNPWRTYKEHWTNWSDVFWTPIAKCLTTRVHINTLILLIQRNKIKSGNEYEKFWHEWHHELNIPSRPQNAYSLEKNWNAFPKWQTLRDFIDFANKQTLDIIK
jgi:Phage-integrase repeat unit